MTYFFYKKLFLESLEMNANIAINWLNNNEMVANPKIFQLMFLARNKSIEKVMPFLKKQYNLPAQLSY